MVAGISVRGGGGVASGHSAGEHFDLGMWTKFQGGFLADDGPNSSGAPQTRV